MRTFELPLHAGKGSPEAAAPSAAERDRGLIDGHDLVLPAQRLAGDGFEAWAQVLERGYEGLIGKDEASPYLEGRTLSWLKVKVPAYRLKERGFYDPDRVG